MFIGHFGPASFFARRKLPLWHCFLAVQVIDYIFFSLVFRGVEHVEIVPNATAVNHFHTEHIGYSHSLISAVIFSVIAFWLYQLKNPSAGRSGALLIGALVFSHWLLDLVAHLPDLPLWPHGPVVGLGLWAFFWPSIIVESALFSVGALVFFVLNRDRASRWTMPAILLLIVVALALVCVGFTGAAPRDVQSGLAAAPFVLLVLTGLAYLVDRSLMSEVE